MQFATVRNLKKTNVVLSRPDRASIAVEWKPAGDHYGEDVQQVSEEYTGNPNFLRAVGLGILQVVPDGDEALARSIEQQAARYQRSTQATEDDIERLIDRSTQHGVIRITDDEMDAHISALSKSTASALSTLGEGAST